MKLIEKMKSRLADPVSYTHLRKGFWDKNAGRYDRFMRNDRAAYEKMYGLIRPVVKAKTVLEVEMCIRDSP